MKVKLEEVGVCWGIISLHLRLQPPWPAGCVTQDEEGRLHSLPVERNGIISHALGDYAFVCVCVCINMCMFICMCLCVYMFVCVLV